MAILVNLIYHNICFRVHWKTVAKCGITRSNDFVLTRQLSWLVAKTMYVSCTKTLNI